MAQQADWHRAPLWPARRIGCGGRRNAAWLDRFGAGAGVLVFGRKKFRDHLGQGKAAIGLLIAIFALLEFWPRFQSLALPSRWIPFGGLLSGFFGGLSGNQGALRSAFLIKAGLSKEAFVATGAVAAVMVDVVRIGVYGSGTFASYLGQSRALAVPVLTATLFAFLGSYFGKKLLAKATMLSIRLIVAGAMIVIGVGLSIGLV